MKISLYSASSKERPRVLGCALHMQQLQYKFLAKRNVQRLGLLLVRMQALPATGTKTTVEAFESALNRMLQLAVFLESPVYDHLPYGSLVVRIPQRFVQSIDP